MKFRDFPGNDSLKTTFKSLIEHKQLPHCILLTGEQGGSVFPFALAISSALLCADSNGEACGNCGQCKKYLANFTHPDLHFSFPIVIPKGNKDATSNSFREKWNSFIVKSPFITQFNWLDYIGETHKNGTIPVTEIREIIRFSQLYSYEDGPKVILIWNADLLGEKGNRLLKLIEEPPINTYIILVAQNEESILNTIRSRSQHFHVQNPSSILLKEYLRINFLHNTEEDIDHAVLLSENNVAFAIELLNNNITEQVKMLLPWLRDCYKGDASQLYSWSNSFNKFSKEEQKSFWMNFLQFLQGLQRIKVGSNSQLRLTQTQAKAAYNMATILRIESLAGIYDVINQSIYALERNAKADLAFMTASFRIHRLFRMK